MKRILLAIAACMAVVTVCAQPKTQSIKDINIRDPFIVADASSGVYYMSMPRMERCVAGWRYSAAATSRIGRGPCV